MAEKKVFLKVVPDIMGSCEGCFLREREKDLSLGCSCVPYRELLGHCGSPSRADGQGVIFKEEQPQMELEPCIGCHQENCNECIVFNQDRLEQEKIISKEKTLEEQISFLVGLLTERQLEEFTSFLNK